MKQKICVAQIGYSSRGTEAQIERIKQIILVNRKADLIVFPELIVHGHPSLKEPEGLLFRRARTSHRSVSTDLYAFIRECGARVVMGELKKRGEKYYNLATCVSPETIRHYVKAQVHWTENFVRGKELVVVGKRPFRFGMNICFDAAFPELWRVLALKGAQAVVNLSAVPASFPVRYVWRRLRGAALDNQMFVIYANRPGPLFSGHSAVFGPDGDCLISAGEGESVFHVDIDLAEVQRWRATEKIYQNRRPALYRLIGQIREPLRPRVRSGAKRQPGAGNRSDAIQAAKPSGSWGRA